jgi:hypothetical protein
MYYIKTLKSNKKERMKKVSKKTTKRFKTELISIRVSPEEKATICRLAEAYVGIDDVGRLSKWVRFAALNHWNEKGMRK